MTVLLVRSQKTKRPARRSGRPSDLLTAPSLSAGKRSFDRFGGFVGGDPQLPEETAIVRRYLERPADRHRPRRTLHTGHRLRLLTAVRKPDDRLQRDLHIET